MPDDTHAATATPPTSAVMMQLLGGFQLSQAVYVVAKLGVPPCSSSEDR